MLRTPPLAKMASTHGGMRRILKKRLPVQKYIELAVKAGSYKSPSTRPNYLGLHDVPEPKGYMSPREREERLKLQRGIIDYPSEVCIVISFIFYVDVLYVTFCAHHAHFCNFSHLNKHTPNQYLIHTV